MSPSVCSHDCRPSSSSPAWAARRFIAGSPKERFRCRCAWVRARLPGAGRTWSAGRNRAPLSTTDSAPSDESRACAARRQRTLDAVHGTTRLRLRSRAGNTAQLPARRARPAARTAPPAGGVRGGRRSLNVRYRAQAAFVAAVSWRRCRETDRAFAPCLVPSLQTPVVPVVAVVCIERPADGARSRRLAWRACGLLRCPMQREPWRFRTRPWLRRAVTVSASASLSCRRVLD